MKGGNSKRRDAEREKEHQKRARIVRQANNLEKEEIYSTKIIIDRKTL